ncbi:hypothetical protein PUR28_27930 [Streptomyces sp. BE308]|nr:hypothetical protein [Streptomyces sp. BE308]MEE1794558.1 hypothetical protein [Streptomyces sp. BE308]
MGIKEEMNAKAEEARRKLGPQSGDEGGQQNDDAGLDDDTQDDRD